LLIGGFTFASVASGSRGPEAHAAAATCGNPQDANPRDPANPLDLPTAPGVNPLHGAHFMVEGPAHGTVAKAIEKLIGDNTKYSDTHTWEDFRASLLSGPLSGKVAASGKTSDVRLLIKIGDQEETNNISLFAEGGGKGAIYDQTLKINCTHILADPPGDAASGDAPPGTSVRPGASAAIAAENPTIPVLSTFLVYPHGQFCAPYPALYDWIVKPEDGIKGHPSIFKRMVNEMAAAQDMRRAVYLLEIDTVGVSQCLKGKSLKLWEYGLRYEIKKMSTLPHVVAYQEAGSSDENTVAYVAHVLHGICVAVDPLTNPDPDSHSGPVANQCKLLRGFWTNGTHFNWSIDEIKWFRKVSKRLDKLIFASLHEHYHGFHVVNTAQNGRGALRTRNAVKSGNSVLCNPLGRGLGRQPTANTLPTFDGRTFDGKWYHKITDAFLWSGVPGKSHNSNCPNGPWAAAGVFDPRFAGILARNANQQLGPGFPSQPY
jgi:hypothetical protein